MKFLKKPLVAIVLTVLLVVGSTFLSADRKLSRSALRVADGFYAGIRYKGQMHESVAQSIRTLCADIGKELGCGGVMAALRRTACGAFTVDDAHTPEELERMTEAERFSVLRPTEELFSDLPELSLPPFQRKLCASGCAISLKKLGADFPEGALLRLYGGGKFFALGKVGLCENGPAVKAVKQFYFFEKDD